MVEFNNLTEEDIPVDDLESLAHKVGGDRDISIAFLLPEEMATLNERYRKKKGATDVLSFEGDGDYLGEVLICPRVVKKVAEENNLKYEDEIRRVLVHGILHLMGYDHQTEEEMKKMRDIEERHLFC